MKKNCSLNFLCLAVLLFLPEKTHAMTRAESLANSFEVMCMTQSLDFERSDAQATAMRLQIVQDVNPPKDKSGYFVHAKTWVLPLNDGPHAFMAAEAYGPQGHTQSCGIADNDVDAESFKKAFLQSAKIDASSSPVSQDGVHYASKWPYGPDTNILFVTPAPGRQAGGIFISVMQVKP